MKINSPAELRALSLPELRILSDEIRQMILAACMKNGGHLGASLGTVELAIALHTVFESPKDALIWDVGHQAYAHKLLTGRWDQFASLRLEGGISGFLSRSESPHDIFGAGHSSTSLSAALGLARARFTQNLKDWTVAIIGDGGLTAGMAFEALNNLRETSTAPLLVVVNDNQMSISKNSGAIPAILASNQAENFFNLFGGKYHGPVDGHDLEALISTLHELKQPPRSPLVLHVITQKGKGYAPAEELPTTFHGIGPISQKTVEKVPGVSEPPKSQGHAKTYSETLGDALLELASQDQKLVAVTAAMKEGTGLVNFSEKYPERFHDVGIAEPHAVTFAAGLAVGGNKPVACIYSTFLQRALDSVIHDVCIQKLPVIFAIDRAGVVGPDGPTHHGAFDLAYLGAIPGLRISSPSCLSDLPELLSRALDAGGPWAIRYPRGSDALTLEPALKAANSHGSVRFHHKAAHPRLVVVALGPTASRAQAALKTIDSSEITLISTIDAKPIAQEILDYLGDHPDSALLTIEDGAVRGGFGQALAGELPHHRGTREHAGYHSNLGNRGDQDKDEFIPQASPARQEDGQGLSAPKLAARMKALLGPF